jgi:hypothetical protein
MKARIITAAALALVAFAGIAPAEARWDGDGRWHEDRRWDSGNRWDNGNNYNRYNGNYYRPPPTTYTTPYNYGYVPPPVYYDTTPGFTIRIQ